MMNFSLEQLLAFVTVYEQKAFSKAAVKLDKHRTTIGQVITNLEDQLAITLFERIGRSVEPTEDATLLYHYAKQAIEQTRTFDRVALSLSFGGLESITFAYASFIPQDVLVQIRKQLMQDFPSMNVNWLVRTKPEIKQSIQDGSIHFGLVNVFTSKVINSLSSSLLHNMGFVPFTGVDTELAKLPPSETFITMKSSKQFVLKSMLDDDMASRVIISSNYEVVDQQTLIVQMVQEGLGWALLPKSINKSDHFSDGIVEIAADETNGKEAVLVPISLWCQHSKQNVDIKKSIIACLDKYLNKVRN
ncbi:MULTISPECIES: LysR family transcriptional regulator [Shewanella]|uniref:LysR family transcriptional regulator n=1 Tax=Shewanella holmiensis TaxID=2952222 RepID=A0A9X3AUU6_9GAMM|nr:MULTISPECIES: LysR family transcriptional regulator [Shewanella]MCT7941930.1 LysR family transcriptional regulator [Shewanella holmiensis]MDP5146334.1 LysR family transcriptional regulator [Shewanella sp. ULN5]